MTKVKSVERPHEIMNGINVKKSNVPIIKKSFESCLYEALIRKGVNIKAIK